MKYEIVQLANVVALYTFQIFRYMCTSAQNAQMHRFYELVLITLEQGKIGSLL